MQKESAKREDKPSFLPISISLWLLGTVLIEQPRYAGLENSVSAAPFLNMGLPIA